MRYTTVSMNNSQWELVDYGDLLPWKTVSKELIGDLNSTECEKNRRFIIHLAAGLRIHRLKHEGSGIFGGFQKSQRYQPM